jgi:hypothetical protein
VEFGHGSHVGAEHGELAGEEVVEVEFGVGAGGCAAGDQGAGGFEGFEAFVPGGGADVFEHDVTSLFVGDLADFFGDFLLVVVDDVVGAEGEGFG